MGILLRDSSRSQAVYGISVYINPAPRAVIDHLRTHALRLAPPGEPFTLASGEKSDYFIDVKRTALDPVGLALLAHPLWYNAYELTQERGPEAFVGILDAVAGVELGGCPLATAVSLYSQQVFERQSDRNDDARKYDDVPTPMLAALYVRKAPKGHGTGNLIEGNLKPRMRTVLIEDVVTTGESSIRAVMALRAAGANVIGVLSVVDRLQGGAKAFRAADIPYNALVTIDELMG